MSFFTQRATASFDNKWRVYLIIYYIQSFRDIWTRTVAEDALGRRMSVLGVSEAKSPDGGRWSCAVQDAGRRRCRALRLSVLKPPDIRLIPSTLTVNKVSHVQKRMIEVPLNSLIEKCPKIRVAHR